MQRHDDHEFIEPLEVSLTIDGRAVVVRPLTARQLPQVLAKCAPLLRQLALFDAGAIGRFRDGAPTEQDLATLLGVVEADLDDIFATVTICSGEPAEWVDTLLPDRFGKLAAVCIEVNRDFFARALPPAIVRAIAAAAGLDGLATPNASSGSPPAATAT